jgi:hypothetical protein
MGAEPYWYFVPYERDVAAALERLRQAEFAAGRYSPVIPFPDFGKPEFEKTAPGPEHPTIEAAFAAGMEADEGTRSILDVVRVGESPGFRVATPFEVDLLREALGTETPTRAEVEKALPDLFETMDRGEAHYLVIYADGQPSLLLFAGYSFD